MGLSTPCDCGLLYRSCCRPWPAWLPRHPSGRPVSFARRGAAWGLGPISITATRAAVQAPSAAYSLRKSISPSPRPRLPEVSLRARRRPLPPVPISFPRAAVPSSCCFRLRFRVRP
uniref:Uncharacterized protein n=1 Tax=Oryza meridionalis TaxID=40149 RepID=A0A0E0D2P3_9ORYZ